MQLDKLTRIFRRRQVLPPHPRRRVLRRARPRSAPPAGPRSELCRAAAAPAPAARWAREPEAAEDFAGRGLLAAFVCVAARSACACACACVWVRVGLREHACALACVRARSCACLCGRWDECAGRPAASGERVAVDGRRGMASGGGRGRRPRTFRTTCCRRRARARVCAADLPHHVPAGLHGFYWGSEAEASPGPRAGAGRATNRARPGGGRCYKLWTRLGPSLGCLTRPGPAAASLSCMNVGSCSPRAPRPPLLPRCPARLARPAAAPLLRAASCPAAASLSFINVGSRYTRRRSPSPARPPLLPSRPTSGLGVKPAAALPSRKLHLRRLIMCVKMCAGVRACVTAAA